MKKFLYTIIALLGFAFTAQAQNGEIQGKVTDDKGEAVPFAEVRIVSDKAGTRPTSKVTKTDLNGFYTLKGVAPGSYFVMAKALGKGKTIEEITVVGGRPVTLDFSLGGNTTKLNELVVTFKPSKKIPKIIDVFQPKENVVNEKEIKEASVRDVNSLAGSTGGVVQEDVGAAINVGGGRSDGVQYVVDGVKMLGTPNLAPGSISQMEIYTSGIPAKYGDANAGVISLTTKGPSDKLRGGIEGLTSQFLDPFGYNLIGANLSGPILRKKAIIDSSNPAIPFKKEKGEAILGFFINGEYQSDGDRFPTINGNWKVNDAKYQEILKTPYQLSDDNKQLLLSQSFLTNSDLIRTNSHQNTAGRTIRLNGKIDWKVIPNSTNITIGARYDNDRYNDYISRYSLLNYQNNRVVENKGYSGFFRIYQPLSNTEKQTKKSIRNATMQLQFDFARSGQDYYSPVGGFNPWDYGYIGKFEEVLTKQVVRTEGGDGTKVYYAPNQYLLFGDNLMTNSYTSTGVNYTKGNVNPLAAYQTEQFIYMYQKYIGNLASITDIANAGGIINGNRANNLVHDLFYPSARIYNGIQKEENDQFRASGVFNFDIVNKKSKNLNKHTIEAGFEIEQRIINKYQLSPNTFWTTAQSALLNSHLSADNTKNYNPLLIMRSGSVKMRLQDYMKQLADTTSNKIYFAPFDSIFYDVEVSNGQQTNFSRNLRESLGIDSLKRLNIHELDPSKMKVEWFSADELSNNSFLTAAYGYDAYGNRLSPSTSFNNFFTEKDSKGNFLRNVAPFMPRYGAGYIQDRFQLNDIAFNVGLRVDYFDANGHQLIDPYVPQGARDISDADVKSKFGSLIPSNLPSNAVIYVDNPTNPTRPTGYRVGSKWYDKTGNELLGPGAIELETGSNVIPYLKGNTPEERDKRTMGTSTFDPNLMFKKSDAQFKLAPRVNFSFKIDSFGLLFAHYDVLNQRPDQDATIVTALNYYNLLERKSSQFINNSNLSFSTTSDLEIGFKQRLSTRSSLTVNFQYREFMNQVSVARINGAYPGSYNTFGNTDFSTQKAIGLAYELRRTNNLRLKANYTMQFADGTSSSRSTQQNIINSGQGNLKVIFPLDFDTRHNFNLNANYRFEDGADYIGPAKMKKILQNFGVNIDLNLRSGTPYSLQSNATPESFLNSTARATNLGDVNAANMPWRFNVNLKLDKDFVFRFGKKSKDSIGLDERKEYSFNVFLQITNLFNTFNTIKVFRFTGDARSDGYLSSNDGVLLYNQNEAIKQGYGQAFRDLYNVSLEIPDNRSSMFAKPRIMRLGATLSF